MSKHFGFLMDMASCNNCKTCEVSCKMERRLPYGVKWRRVRTNEFAAGKRFELGFLTMSCNHCEKPACKEACPVSAYTIDAATGAVTQDISICIGCQACVEACPYKAPVYDADLNKASKCDMCVDRLKASKPPKCADNCPNNALIFGTMEDLDKMAALLGGGVKRINSSKITPEPVTEPSILICPTENSKI